MEEVHSTVSMWSVVRRGFQCGFGNVRLRSVYVPKLSWWKIRNGPVKVRPKTSSFEGVMSLGAVVGVTSSFEESRSGSVEL